jgi:hypothetical protein
VISGGDDSDSSHMTFSSNYCPAVQRISGNGMQAMRCNMEGAMNVWERKGGQQ